ncbi:MAG: hypothetical protein QM790_10800 [Nibricoccus sp.]
MAYARIFGRELGRCAIVGLGMLVSLGVQRAYAWDRADVLAAIHEVENPHNTTRIGRRGELGPFQFRPAVWYTYTQKPFSYAADTAESQAVAEAHYDWIKRGLERNKVEVTPYHIGLAWNAGLHATLNDRASSTAKYYAQRVSNLVESKQAAPAGEGTAVAAEQTKPPQS